MYCASLPFAQNCNYCLCLTCIRETKSRPLDNLYTAASFPSEIPRTCLSCFVPLATDSDPKSLSWLQVLPSSCAPCFHSDTPWAVEEKTSQGDWETGPTRHGKICRKGSVWKSLYGLSTALLLVINEIMWDCAKRQPDRVGVLCDITERAGHKHYREELADALM